ncbi:MAG TPA: hypothetical protein VI793_09920 [Anaerolineales bacterium]|nr:hypothetical protein [Anaerolineales bacterium]
MSDFLHDGMFPIEEAPCVIETPSPRLPDFERPGDPRLLAEGWERRFMADLERLSEYIELYTSLGFEVRTEKVPPEEIGPECSDCRLIICRQFLTLYTRKRQIDQ